MNGERSYTTKIWPQPSWIESWSVDGSFTSMGLRGGPAISNWKRPCFQTQNGSEFPEFAAQNFRNPQGSYESGNCALKICATKGVHPKSLH